MYYVYLLKSKQYQEIYVGSTNDLRRRFAEHNEGKMPSTKRYKPWTLFYYEAYVIEKLARLRESRLKHNGNAIRELKKRIGLFKGGAVLPSTTFNIKSGAGFTILELMVTIGIFALILGAALVNFRAGERNAALRLAAEQLAQDIRSTQGMVLAGQVSSYQEEGESEVKEQFPDRGYGMVFVREAVFRSYTLFAVKRSGEPASPSLSQVSFPNDVLVKDISLSGSATQQLFLFFRPPNATAIFQIARDGPPSDATEAVITLLHTVTGQERRVTVNRVSGKVSVEATGNE